MRISDWSSDVCSSDLHIARNHVEAGSLAGAVGAYERQDLAFLDFERHPIDSRQTAKALDQVFYFKNLHGSGLLLCQRLDLAQEIGRASCRERVCQYV